MLYSAANYEFQHKSINRKREDIDASWHYDSKAPKGWVWRGKDDKKRLVRETDAEAERTREGEQAAYLLAALRTWLHRYAPSPLPLKGFSLTIITAIQDPKEWTATARHARVSHSSLNPNRSQTLGRLVRSFVEAVYLITKARWAGAKLKERITWTNDWDSKCFTSPSGTEQGTHLRKLQRFCKSYVGVKPVVGNWQEDQVGRFDPYTAFGIGASDWIVRFREAATTAAGKVQRPKVKKKTK